MNIWLRLLMQSESSDEEAVSRRRTASGISVQRMAACQHRGELLLYPHFHLSTPLYNVYFHSSNFPLFFFSLARPSGLFPLCILPLFWFTSSSHALQSVAHKVSEQISFLNQFLLGVGVLVNGRSTAAYYVLQLTPILFKGLQYIIILTSIIITVSTPTSTTKDGLLLI